MPPPPPVTRGTTSLNPALVPMRRVFDSSAALATLHGVRQTLRAVFSAQRVDSAHVLSVAAVCDADATVALYVCAMLALLVAQAVLDHGLAAVDGLDALLAAVLRSLVRHRASSALPSSSHGASTRRRVDY